MTTYYDKGIAAMGGGLYNISAKYILYRIIKNCLM
jgi:hypothetical protein